MHMPCPVFLLRPFMQKVQSRQGVGLPTLLGRRRGKVYTCMYVCVGHPIFKPTGHVTFMALQGQVVDMDAAPGAVPPAWPIFIKCLINEGKRANAPDGTVQCLEDTDRTFLASEARAVKTAGGQDGAHAVSSKSLRLNPAPISQLSNTYNQSIQPGPRDDVS